MIPSAPSSGQNVAVSFNLWSQTVSILRITRTRHAVYLSIMGISWFWFMSSAITAQFPNLTRLHLHGDSTVVTLVLAVFTLSLALGSLACERLSGHRIELGIVPVGAAGLSLGGIDLYFAIESLAVSASVGWQGFLALDGALTILIDVFLTGFFGGMFIVPLYALVQIRTPEDRRARMIAANNVINSIFIVSSAVLAILLLAGAIRRRVRFITYRPIFDIPVLNFVFRTSRAIPIDSRTTAPEAYEAAFEAIHNGLRAGDLLCIFPEGALTRDGEIAELKRGIERIIRETPVKVLPLALRGLWGSFFSHEGSDVFRPKGRFWSRVHVVAGDIVQPAEVTAELIETRVRELRGDAA